MNLKTRLSKLERDINPPDNTVTVRFGIEGGEPGEPFTILLSTWKAVEKDLLEAGIWTIIHKED